MQRKSRVSKPPEATPSSLTRKTSLHLHDVHSSSAASSLPAKLVVTAAPPPPPQKRRARRGDDPVKPNTPSLTSRFAEIGVTLDDRFEEEPRLASGQAHQPVNAEALAAALAQHKENEPPAQSAPTAAACAAASAPAADEPGRPSCKEVTAAPAASSPTVDAMKQGLSAGTQAIGAAAADTPAKNKRGRKKPAADLPATAQAPKHTSQTDIRKFLSAETPSTRRSGSRVCVSTAKQTLEQVHELLRSKSEPGLERVAMLHKGGWGVLARKSFVAGEFVCEYSGDLVTLAEARRREAAYIAEDAYRGATEPMCYMYFLRHADKAYCVDATKSGRIGRFINHSRSAPNLVTKLFVVDGTPRLGLCANMDIADGTELAYDYGEKDPATMRAHPWLKA